MVQQHVRINESKILRLVKIVYMFLELNFVLLLFSKVRSSNAPQF